MEDLKTILQLKPAKCDGSCDTSVEHVAERKIDGHRALLHFGKHLTRAYLTSRRISIKTGEFAENGLKVPQIIVPADKYAQKRGLGYTVLDGEIVIPGEPFEAVQSVLGCKPGKAIMRQEKGPKAVFKVFDILFYGNVDVRVLPWVERRSLFVNRILGDRRVARLGVSLKSEFIHEEEVLYGTDHSRIFNRIVAEGGEGLVLKDPQAIYGKGWTKWKKEETYDVVIMGFTEGNKKLRGMFGAVRFGAYKDGALVEIGKCSGMPEGECFYVNDAGDTVAPNSPGCLLKPLYEDGQEPGTRAWFHANRERLIGSVIEVECKGLTKKRKLRHPQFFRIREDKLAAQCVAP